MPDRPEIVCLCGSMRFADEMRAANQELTLAGAIVVAPTLFPHPDDPAAGAQLSPAQLAALGELHLRKIELADRVVIVNPGGYLGESTRRELDHARATGTPVSFTHPTDPAAHDASPHRI